MKKLFLKYWRLGYVFYFLLDIYWAAFFKEPNWFFVLNCLWVLLFLWLQNGHIKHLAAMVELQERQRRVVARFEELDMERNQEWYGSYETRNVLLTHDWMKEGF